MKYLFGIFIIIIFSIQLKAQFDSDLFSNCIPGEIESIASNQIGGYALASVGTVNVLIIFAQFPDDDNIKFGEQL